jgi:POT family proton-dependent oligopeptide transporter
MGLTFMSLFISNNLIGWIGGFYERMCPAQFWTRRVNGAKLRDEQPSGR